ncbi:MAG: L,D-transpeptidase family protein [Alphaproteobacteria bacterium]|nr:L,D-transpeptidase family protein [Alphaproteobacteria bacterium]
MRKDRDPPRSTTREWAAACRRIARLSASFVAAVAAYGIAADPAAAAELPARGEVIGTLREHRVTEADTLPDIARRFDLGFVALRAANPRVDPWLPKPGTVLTLPTAHILPDGARDGIVINLPEQRLYLFRATPGTVTTFPVGTPKAGCAIPQGTTTVKRKRPNPVWTPPPSIRAEQPDLPDHVPPGPANPLGRYALDLGWPGYVIHGTNKPDGIGRRVTHGCIRLYPEDIEQLFASVPVGGRVTVVDQPVKIGWSDGALYLEAHPTLDELDRIESLGLVPRPVIDSVDSATESRIRVKAGPLANRIDWEAVREILHNRRGIPKRITKD